MNNEQTTNEAQGCVKRYEIVLSTNPSELRAAANLAYQVGRSVLADEFSRIADIVEEMSDCYHRDV